MAVPHCHYLEFDCDFFEGAVTNIVGIGENFVDGMPGTKIFFECHHEVFVKKECYLIQCAVSEQADEVGDVGQKTSVGWITRGREKLNIVDEMTEFRV